MIGLTGRLSRGGLCKNSGTALSPYAEPLGQNIRIDLRTLQSSLMQFNLPPL